MTVDRDFWRTAQDKRRIQELRDKRARKNAIETLEGRPLEYTATQVAFLKSVHPETVRRWIRSGELKFVPCGKRVRVRLQDLDDFERACMEKRPLRR